MGMKETTLRVPDMSCGHCVATVQRSLETLEGVEGVDVSLETKMVTVRSIEELGDNDFMAAIKATGFSPESVG